MGTTVTQQTKELVILMVSSAVLQHMCAMLRTTEMRDELL